MRFSIKDGVRVEAWKEPDDTTAARNKILEKPRRYNWLMKRQPRSEMPRAEQTTDMV